MGTTGNDCGNTDDERAHNADRAPGLTELEQAVLDFERGWWKYAGAKEATVRDRFGWSMTRHYQVVNSLLDSPAAEAYDPMLIRRLRRLRSARTRQRTARQRRPIIRP